MKSRLFPNLKRPRRDGRVVTVGSVADVPPGRSATVELGDGTELALYRVGDEFYAVENFCPHRGAPLVDGRVCGRAVECDWHGWRFDLRTGQCQQNPDADIEAYEVRVEDGLIKVVV